MDSTTGPQLAFLHPQITSLGFQEFHLNASDLYVSLRNFYIDWHWNFKGLLHLSWFRPVSRLLLLLCCSYTPLFLDWSVLNTWMKMNQTLHRVSDGMFLPSEVQSSLDIILFDLHRVSHSLEFLSRYCWRRRMNERPILHCYAFLCVF